MNEDNKINYYAIIPATVRYDSNLKPAEKLLYGEITALTNAKGYCYASNRYFANLYNVTLHTVSQWISHLEKLKYITIEMIRDSKKVIRERRIYINDVPYIQKNTYPYVLKSTYPIDENVQENNINKIIEDLFILIINNSDKISEGFYSILNRLEFIYTKEILSIMQDDKVQMLKEIIYTLYCLYNSQFKSLLLKVERQELINLYHISKEQSVGNFFNYYKRTIIKEYSKSNARRLWEMIENYMNNFSNIVTSILFIAFIVVVLLLVASLIISLLLLILGCIIKSQTLKSKFLKSVPILLIGIIFLLCMPIILVHFKELM